MKRVATLVGALFGAAALLSAGAASATTNAEASFRITAHVDAFCKIDAPPTDVVSLTDGAADLGAIKEVCNVPTGYDVVTEFSNVDAGMLHVDIADVAIQSDGEAVRHSATAAVQTLDWRISDAHLVMNDQPVIMRVHIAPH